MVYSVVFARPAQPSAENMGFLAFGALALGDALPESRVIPRESTAHVIQETNLRNGAMRDCAEVIPRGADMGVVILEHNLRGF